MSPIKSTIRLTENAERHLLTEAAVPIISPQEARDRRMSGPLGYENEIQPSEKPVRRAKA